MVLSAKGSCHSGRASPLPPKPRQGYTVGREGLEGRDVLLRHDIISRKEAAGREQEDDEILVDRSALLA